MNPAEIEATYADLSPSEAFEAFDVAGVDSVTVAMVLGPDVEQEYAHWIYLNLK